MESTINKVYEAMEAFDDAARVAATTARLLIIAERNFEELEAPLAPGDEYLVSDAYEKVTVASANDVSAQFDLMRTRILLEVQVELAKACPT